MTIRAGGVIFRWGVAVALGGLAALVNTWAFPILTPETPHFVFGGALVLVVFIGLGVGPGLLAGVISISSFPLAGQWDAHPGAALGSVLHVVEPLAVYLLYRHVRSLPLAAAAFWFGGGWVLTFLIYHVWVGLSVAYVALFFVKQLMNGLLNALGAELILGRWVRRSFLRLRGEPPSPVPVETFAFRGMVLLTLLPLTVLGVLFVRSQYEQVIQEVNARNSEVGWEVASEMDRYLRARHGLLRDLGRTVEIGASDAEIESALNAFMAGHEEFYLVARVSPAGRVVQSSPEANVLGEPLLGLEVGDRDYFLQARDHGELAHGRLRLGDLRVRADEDVEPAMVIAQPITLPDGAFGGALVAGLDPRLAALQLEIAAPVAGRHITLLDSDGAVIGSTRPDREPGTPLASVLRGAGGRALVPLPLEDRSRPATLRYFPPRSESFESRLHANLIHGSFQPVLRSDWGVLIDTPASVLWGRFLPVVYQAVAAVALVLLLLVLTAQQFTRWIALPLRDAADTARRITAGDLTAVPGSSLLPGSPLEESEDLGRSLEQMRETLAARAQATQERQRELEAQLLQAQKMEAVGLLAGGIAHDFNNMLTPIMGLAGMGRDDAESEELRNHFEEITDAALRARDVVQQLLAFSRKQVLSMGATDLEEELHKSRALLRSLLPENIQIEMGSDGANHTILADPAQIQQVLVNLAVNAKDAMPRGGRFGLRLERLDRGGRDLEEEGLHDRPVVRLQVIDDGEGIGSDQLPRIFDPFYTTKEPDRGTGLGLATAYGIVRQHGGAIRVESREGAGTTFGLFFPTTDQPVYRPRPGKPGPSTEAGESRGERILLVEDDEAIRRFLARVLRLKGFRVVAVSGGEEALALPDEERGCDMLLTDVVLPGMNGRELYEELSRRAPRLRALFISGHSHHVLGDEGPPPGTRFLAKPFELPALLEEIRIGLDTPTEASAPHLMAGDGSAGALGS